MSRPSKLKRAIKEIEKEVETLRSQVKLWESDICNKQVIIEKLKKIDGEKHEKNNKD